MVEPLTPAQRKTPKPDNSYLGHRRANHPEGFDRDRANGINGRLVDLLGWLEETTPDIADTGSPHCRTAVRRNREHYGQSGGAHQLRSYRPLRLTHSARREFGWAEQPQDYR
jgi:hypothetical protein